MNSVNVSGYLTQDPKLVYRNNRPICEMRLAVEGVGQTPTYIDIPTFDSQAYVCAEHLRKGNKVAVCGRLAYEEWHTREGAKRYRYSVRGWVEFLEPRPDDRGRERDIEIDDPDNDDFDVDELDFEDLKPQLTFAT